MKLTWHEATDSDHGLLAAWNHQLIHDEGHRNPMSVDELGARMRRWLVGEYRAVIFSDGEPVAYALFKAEADSVHLRQLFVRRDRRSAGVGRAAFLILKEQVWPRDVRLTVDVLCSNQRATTFYRSLGYRDYCLAMEINSQ